MHPIRILYVITDLQLGGVPLHLLRLARAMKDRGHEPIVASLAPAGPVSQMLGQAGILNVGLGACRPWDWRVFERLAALLAEVNPDLVHSLLFHANVAARGACLLSGFPTRRLICEIQTAEIERPWHLTVDRWTQRACRFIVGNSPSVVDHLRSAGRIHLSRLRLVRGGIDPRPIQDAEPIDRRELGVTNADPILIWVGRLDPVKGLDELIDAFGRVRAKRPCNLVLVGDGAYRVQVEVRMRSSTYPRGIYLVGARSDVARVLKAADVFVFPSRTEGMPNALLEAMAAGLPCIAADVPGCRDVLSHGVNGLLVPPRDPASLASAIDALLHDSSLSRRLSSEAAATVEREFNVAGTLNAYSALYGEALSARG